MARRQKDIAEEASVAEQAVIVGPRMLEGPEDPEHWWIGEWKGRKRYQCRYCPFDSLYEETISEHYRGVHATPQSQILAFDTRGNPIVTDKE